MKLVNDYGDIYRMTKSQWVKMLKALAEGRKVGPSDFGGKLIGTAESIRDLEDNQAEVERLLEKEGEARLV